MYLRSDFIVRLASVVPIIYRMRCSILMVTPIKLLPQIGLPGKQEVHFFFELLTPQVMLYIRKHLTLARTIPRASLSWQVIIRYTWIKKILRVVLAVRYTSMNGYRRVLEAVWSLAVSASKPSRA